MIQISILSKIVLTTNNKFKNISEKKQNFSYKLKFIKIVLALPKLKNIIAEIMYSIDGNKNKLDTDQETTFEENDRPVENAD